MEGLTSYRTYWTAWAILLVLTLLMIVTEGASFSRVAIVAFLVSAMLVKAALITGWFMHLRFERAALVVPVVLVTLLTAAFLFFLIAVDGLEMARMAAP
jgi:caa(3)-type oxidase subunit IV